MCKLGKTCKKTPQNIMSNNILGTDFSDGVQLYLVNCAKILSRWGHFTKGSMVVGPNWWIAAKKWVKMGIFILRWRAANSQSLTVGGDNVV